MNARWGLVFSYLAILIVGMRAETSVARPFESPQLAVGRSHYCFLVDKAKISSQWGSSAVQCEGKNDFGEATVPPILHSVTAIAAGDRYSCAIHSAGVHCWGAGARARTAYFSDMGRPKLIAAGYSTFCVYDLEKGLRCREEEGTIHRTTISEEAPKLKNVKALSVGYAQACALQVDGRVTCWGGIQNIGANIDEGFRSRHIDIQKRITAVPAETNGATAVAVGYSHACVAVPKGVRCWGTAPRSGEVIDGLVNIRGVRALSSGLNNSCAINSSGTFCWGWKGTEIQSNLKAIYSPQAIGQSHDYFTREATGYCALDYFSVHCDWGRFDGRSTAARNVTYVTYDFLLQMEETFSQVSDRVYSSRAIFLTRVKKMLEAFPVDAVAYHEKGIETPGLRPRLFVMNAISPIIENIQSQFFEAEVLPRFLAARGYFNSRYGIRSLRDFGYDPVFVRIACELSHAAIGSLRSLITEPEMAKQAAEVGVVLAKAAHSGKKGPDLTAIAEGLGRLEELFESLSLTKRSQGHGLQLMALAEYLKSAAK